MAILTVSSMIGVGGLDSAHAAGSHRATSAEAPATAASGVAYQEDAAHDGHVADPLFTAPLTKSWTASFGGAVWYPLIVGDEVFVDIAGSTEGGTSVEARSLTNGHLLWGPTAIGGLYNFGGLTYEDGRVFALNGNGDLWAFDAQTGAVDWSQQLPGQYSFTSSPTASGGTVYVGGAGSGGTLYAVSEASGDVEWTAQVVNGDSSAPAVDATGVYVSYACEQAYSFTTTGSLRWHHDTDCEGGGGRTDVLHDGRDYIRDDAGFTPAALSETDGTQKGSFVSSTAPAFSGSTMVTVSNGQLVAANVTTTTTLWRSAAIDYTVAPLVINGYVVGGTSDGAVRLLSEKSGKVEWTGSAGTEIAAPDEHNAVGVVGMTEAEGYLAVPADNNLTVFASQGLPKARITAGPSHGAFVRSTATFDFGNNLGKPASYLCTLDKHPATACQSPHTVKHLTSGPHTFSVAAVGQVDAPPTRDFVADRNAPAIALSAFGRPYIVGGWPEVNWTATDSGSGVASYQVRERTIDDHGQTRGWQLPTRLTGLVLPHTTVMALPGQTVCVSVRASDRVGNVSRWTDERCDTRLLDDRFLARSGSWSDGQSPTAYDQTLSHATQRGATLALRGVLAHQIAVRAIMCETCGSIRVSFAGTNETFSLKGTSGHSHLFTLPALEGRQLATLRIRVESTGQLVQIDAVGSAAI